MPWDLLMLAYRAMALGLVVVMAWLILSERNWRTQVCAALVLVPFLLRALGVK